MSLLQQNSRKRISLGQDGNSLVLLIIFNIIVYILLNFVKLVYLANNSTVSVFESQVLNYISVPAQPAVFATRPWTVLLYMFSHYNFWHLLADMLWLWGFGFILQDLTGNRKLIPIYLYGGLAGSLVFLLASNLFPSLRANVNIIIPLLGSGPALMGVVVAATTLSPSYTILRFSRLTIPLWVASIAFLIVIVIGERWEYSHMAALAGGGLIGYLFIWQYQKGNDWGQWMTDLVNWTDDLFNPQKKHRKHPPKNQLFYKSNQKPFEKTPHVTQQRVDDLLDKIHHKGYHSLTEEEKEFLKKASTEDL